MLSEPTLRRAIANIIMRSERQKDIAKLVNAFADPGIIDQLNTENNQILVGRRGTGLSYLAP